MKARLIWQRLRWASVLRIATCATFLTGVLHAAEGNVAEGVLGNTFWETVERGGEVMYVILAFSVVGLGLALEALFRTRRSAILPNAALKALDTPEGERPNVVELIASAKGKRASVYRILTVGHKWQRGTTQQIQAAIEETVDEALWQFKRSLRPIGIIANTTPLLGLLGTVIGIVQAFDVVASQGSLGDPSALADGISKALLTTCFGLIVAIPLLLTYHYFTGRVETLLRKCEELAKEALVLPPE